MCFDARGHPLGITRDLCHVAVKSLTFGCEEVLALCILFKGKWRFAAKIRMRPSPHRLNSFIGLGPQTAAEPRPLSNIEIPADEAVETIVRHLRELCKQGKVLDLFRAWDEDGDGTVDKREFRRAMQLLRLNADKEAVDALFDAFDPDCTGSIEYGELDHKLRDEFEDDDPDKKTRLKKPNPMVTAFLFESWARRVGSPAHLELCCGQREACKNAHFLLCRRAPEKSVRSQPAAGSAGFGSAVTRELASSGAAAPKRQSGTPRHPAHCCLPPRKMTAPASAACAILSLPLPSNVPLPPPPPSPCTFIALERLTLTEGAKVGAGKTPACLAVSSVQPHPFPESTPLTPAGVVTNEAFEQVLCCHLVLLRRDAGVGADESP